ncbi:MAG: hypothetical protein AB7P16_23465 [Bradyrhizobium sp.]|uniref:hypothetical protein n=1 Tax=Bradyrhizobium sp. TaxID=376 RepID=UPI003D147B53
MRRAQDGPPAWCEDYLLLMAGSLGPRPCWELVRRVYQERLGIDLPTHGEVDHRTSVGCAETIAGERDGQDWVPVEPGQECEHDVAIVLRIVRGEAIPAHVGIIAAPGWMLHAEEDRGVSVVRLREMLIDSIRRHKSQA